MSRPTLDTTTQTPWLSTQTPVLPTQTPWLLTVPEVAEIVRSTGQSVRIAIRSGELVAVKPPKQRHYLISRAAVAAWTGLPLEDIRSKCSAQSPGEVGDAA